MNEIKGKKVQLYYSDNSLQLQVLTCLKLLIDEHGTLKLGKELYNHFFELRRKGILSDLEFEDNLNPLSLMLDRLLLGYSRNKLIITEPKIVMMPSALELVESFISRNPNFTSLKTLKEE